MLPKNWTKVHQNPSRSATRTNARHYAKFHRAPPNDVREKRFNFFSILAPLGKPLGRSSPISASMYSKARSTNVPNFVPFFQPVYDIFAAELR